MTPTITKNNDGTCGILLDYHDEGVDLTASTSVIGCESKAAAYVPVFDRDVRSTHSHLFPQPETEIYEN